MQSGPNRETQEARTRLALKNLRFTRRTIATGAKSQAEVSVGASSPSSVLVSSLMCALLTALVVIRSLCKILPARTYDPLVCRMTLRALTPNRFRRCLPILPH